MKYFKTLGLSTALAVVALAAVGAGTGSATVLCKNNSSTTSCTERLGAGTEIKTSLASKLTLQTGFKNIECNKSSLVGKTENEGSSTTTVKGPIETLTLEECNCEVTVLKKGNMELHYISGTDNGTMTSSGGEITTNCSTIFGNVHCIYVTNATDLGVLTGGSPARIKASGAEIPRLTTNALCDEEALLTAEYVGSNEPVFVAAA